MDVTPQVLIVGAGPTGLTLACEFARRGVPFQLVDSAAGTFPGSRAKGLQPRTLEVFEDLGILEGVLASGSDYPGFRVHLGPLSFPAGRLNRIVAPTPAIPYPNLWMLPQWRTCQLLLARLVELGGHVRFGVAVETVEQEADGVTATLATPEGPSRVRVAHLVGCDGGHSVVRKALGVPLIGEALEGSPIVVGDIEVEDLARDRWHSWPLSRGCLLTLCPLPGTPCFQLQAPLRAGVAPPEPTEAGLRAFLERAAGPGQLQVGRIHWSGLYRSVHARLAERFRVGRVFLAGDAAHVHPPSGGQGLNTGVQDAYNLGWKLAAALRGAPPALLDSYEAERQPIAASVLGLSKKLLRARSVRRGSETQQLGLEYRGGPLSDDQRPRSGLLRAGDRAPDAPGRDVAGRPRRLFEAFRGPQWTLLAFGDPKDDLARVSDRRGASVQTVRVRPSREGAAEGDFVDDRGHARAGYGVSSDAWVLVRPDGYVGQFAEPGSWSVLDSYLTRVLGAPA